MVRYAKDQFFKVFLFAKEMVVWMFFDQKKVLVLQELKFKCFDFCT